MEFIINNIGYNYTEKENMIIDRPTGSGDYLFLFFCSEVKVKLNDTIIIAEPNSCIIYTPPFPQWYCNDLVGFTNDWFHFSGDNIDSFLNMLGLPLNSIFHVNNYSFIRLFIKEIETEFFRKDMLWELNVNALLVNTFVRLAREYNHNTEYSINPHRTELLESFKVARVEILTTSEHNWTIEEMCSLVNLSRSRFTVLYKEFFNCSPKEDLINERINKSKHFLSTTSMSVTEVAYKVGYENIYHFNRQFKQITGCSPGRYLKVNSNTKFKK